MLLVCLMEQQLLSKDQGVIGLNKSKAYFTSGIGKNLKSTDLSELIDISYKRILGDFDAYQENGSGWYFKEVVQLKFILLSLTHLRDHLTFLFQIGYQTKKQLLIFKTKMRNVFFGVYVDIFIQKNCMKKD